MSDIFLAKLMLFLAPQHVSPLPMTLTGQLEPTIVQFGKEGKLLFAATALSPGFPGVLLISSWVYSHSGSTNVLEENNNMLYSGIPSLVYFIITQFSNSFPLCLKLTFFPST
jgi:hypothetical protein